jgi:hypothetical protein
MKTSRTSPVQYAVIQVRESDAGTERCVIGYHDERTLRQLLAERSIVATGFSSRDEATKQSFTAGIGHRSPFLNVVFPPFHQFAHASPERNSIRRVPGLSRAKRSHDSD